MGIRRLKVAPPLVERVLREGSGAFDTLDPLPDDARMTGVEWDVDGFGRTLAVLVFQSPSWKNAEPEVWAPMFRRKEGS